MTTQDLVLALYYSSTVVLVLATIAAIGWQWYEDGHPCNLTLQADDADEE